MSHVVFSLGANLGDRLATMQAALDRLASYDGIAVETVSPVYETDPVGGPADQPPYLNAVVLAEVVLTPRELIALTQHVERLLGRQRAEKWGPRVIDVDIVAYDDEVSDDPEVTLPHPAAAERAFVLAPWLDADPEGILPGVAPVAVLLDKVCTEGVRRTDLVLRRP